MKGYYFITDSKLSRRGNISDVRCALAAGVEIVQYREKSLDTHLMYLEALKLRKLCKDITFIVNDRLDLTLAVGADGLHLGQEDIPYAVARRILGGRKIIGLTVNTLKEALEAQQLGVDYIGVAPIFATGTKTGAGRSVGTRMLKAVRKKIKIPIVAIGGINLHNAPEVIQSGADGLCAISAVVTKPDVKKEILKFQRLF
jgi:thiamine-phosphate pyrophosphorylase